MRALGQISGWLRRHPWMSDALMAGILMLVAVPQLIGSEPIPDRFRPPDAFAAALLLLEILPVAYRRRSPHAALAVGATALFLQGAFGYSPGTGLLGVAIADYTVARLPGRRLSTGAAAVVMVAVLAAPFLHQGQLNGDDFGGGLFALGLPWLIGDIRRTRALHEIALHQQEEKAERDRVEGAARAVAAERARLARELHDVVAHAVSVAVVQAQAAERVVKTDPQEASAHIAAIETTSRQAMAELRRLLDVLRADGDDEGSFAPQPGVSDLPALVQRMRDAGLPTTMSVQGDPVVLPASVGLSAYRIVQEALTNSLKHGGRRADVRLRYGGDALQVLVVDDGPGALTMDAGDGHGLLGMRERVALFGGIFEAGPRTEGGFEVRVDLPLGVVAP